MPRGIKQRDHENLSDANIRKVIVKLNSSPSITKKEACAMLNISYNTSRLSKIIEEYRASQDFIKKMKAKKRGLPAKPAEKGHIIASFLEGASLTDIAKSNYRSVAFVKNIIDLVGVPERPKGEERVGVQYLPDECMSEEFSPGEIAWSARYHSSCKIVKRLSDEKYVPIYGSPCYDVYINEDGESTIKGGFYASSIAYDLGKLEHLKEYGIDLNNV
jgi:hypothetical protein